MHHAGTAREGRGIQPFSNGPVQLLRHILGHHILIGIDYINLSTSHLQRIGDHVPRNRRACQQDSFAINLIAQALHEPLGDIAGWNYFHAKTGAPCRVSRRAANSGYLQPLSIGRIHTEKHATSANSLKRIKTCKNQPIVSIQILQRVIQRCVRLRRYNLQSWNQNRLCAQRAQSVDELACLQPSTGNEHPSSSQRKRTHREPPSEV